MSKKKEVSITSTIKGDVDICIVFEEMMNEYIEDHKEEFLEMIVDRLVEGKCLHVWDLIQNGNHDTQICKSCHLRRVVK